MKIANVKNTRVYAEAAAGVCGLILWLVVRNFALQGWDWMLCFIGYPMICTWLFCLLYAYNHHSSF